MELVTSRLLQSGIYDLGRARQDLKDQLWGRKLSGLIKRLLDHRSAILDLEQVKQALRRIKELNATQGNPGSLEYINAGDEARALVVFALVVYMRATETSSDERTVKLPIRDWLTVDQIADHERLKYLRNTCVAHFGSGSSKDHESWHDETVTYVAHGSKFKLDFPYRRANIVGQDVARIDKLTKTIFEKAQSVIDEDEINVAAEICKCPRDKLDEIISRYPFSESPMVQETDMELRGILMPNWHDPSPLPDKA